MNQSDLSRNRYMLKGKLARNGYDWWWHSFTAIHAQTGEEKAFYVEYFFINPEESPNHIVLGQQDDLCKPIKPSYCMINCGTWGKNPKQLHRFYPIKDVTICNEKLELYTHECYLSEHKMAGKVTVSTVEAAKPEYMSDSGSMEWNLSIDKKIAFNVGYGASKLFRSLHAFEMFWHAEGIKTLYSGTVILDGEQYHVIPETSYGYADKNWGKDYTSPWVWISSCNMVSNLTHQKLHNSVLEVGGGRPKIAGVAMNRKLLIDFVHEGKEYEFNFSKFWTLVRTGFDCYEEVDRIVWKIETQNPKYLLKIKCYCKKDEMLLINYEAPDGVKRHNRLWNGGTGFGEIRLYRKEKNKNTLIDSICFKNAGCEWGEYGEQSEEKMK